MNEDIPYIFDSSVTSTDTTRDVDHNNKSILVQQLADYDRLIALHNTLDVINPESKLSGEQQIGAHKLLVSYLRNYRDELAKKVETLTNGR